MRRKQSAGRPSRALTRLRRRRRQFVYFTLVWGPLVGGLLVMTTRFWPEAPILQWNERGFQAVCVLWAILLARFVFSECPRCTDFFWQRGVIGGGGGFSDRCVHCGLELYPPDDAQPKTAVD